MEDNKTVEQIEQHKPLNKYALYISLGIFLFLVLLLVYLFRYNIFSLSDYVYLEDRTSYIIKDVDDNFLNNYYGKDNTMVKFSASWCRYCVVEQDELNTFIMNNPDKKIIIVSHDRTYEDLENYLKENNFNWFVIYDKDKTIREKIDPGSSGIPSVYLIDRKGEIIGFSKGPKTTEYLLNFYNNEVGIY